MSSSGHDPVGLGQLPDFNLSQCGHNGDTQEHLPAAEAYDQLFYPAALGDGVSTDSSNQTDGSQCSPSFQFASGTQGPAPENVNLSNSWDFPLNVVDSNVDTAAAGDQANGVFNSFQNSLDPALAGQNNEHSVGQFLNVIALPIRARANQETTTGTEKPTPFSDLETLDVTKLLNPEAYGMDTNTKFPSAQAANLSVMPNPATNANGHHDSTVPQTSVQMKALAKAMSVAMASVNHAQDGDTMIRPFLEGKYSTERIEVTCWNVLEACIARHTTGRRLQAAFAEVIDRPSGRTKVFAKRMKDIIECLATRKTICKRLLEPSYLYSFVDDPQSMVKRIVCNQQVNSKKSETISAGREAMARDLKAAAEAHKTPKAPRAGFKAEQKDVSKVSLGPMPSNARDPFVTPQNPPSVRPILSNGFQASPRWMLMGPAPSQGTSHPHQQNAPGSSAQGNLIAPASGSHGIRSPHGHAGSAAFGGTLQQVPATPTGSTICTSAPSSHKRRSKETEGFCAGSPTKKKHR